MKLPGMKMPKSLALPTRNVIGPGMHILGMGSMKKLGYPASGKAHRRAPKIGAMPKSPSPKGFTSG